MKQELKDLLDNSSPVMEVFKEKCPGTFRHCQSVAILCEAMAAELNLDSDVLITAAKLHDIGKSNNPNWFSENQPDDSNPHDDVEPPISYQYISRHVADSVLKLTQIPEIPRDVIICVSEHHGDSIIQGIFFKAKKLYNGSTNEEQYRYKNRKPTSIESAVLMICDVIESTTKSLYNNDKLSDVKTCIDDSINKMIDDEQLDILTIGHIRIIKKVLNKEIDSIYHKRVDYDTDDDNGVE